MKSTISFVLLVICTVVLAAQQSQAKKGCSAYGHACYGGHGKRSLGSLVGGGNGNGNGGNGNGNGAGGNGVGEQDDIVVHPDAILQVFPNEGTAVLTDGDMDAFPRYRLIKIMKSWFSGHGRRGSDRISEIDYPISGEAFNRDRESSNIFN